MRNPSSTDMREADGRSGRSPVLPRDRRTTWRGHRVTLGQRSKVGIWVHVFSFLCPVSSAAAGPW